MRSRKVGTRLASPLDDGGCVPLWFVPMGDIHTELLAEIEAFLATHQIAPSKFGRLAVNDGKIVSRIRARKDIRVVTINRIRDFLQSRASKDAA